VFSMMREDAPHALDWQCLAALMESEPALEDSLTEDLALVAV
jgi:hypothetical protein